MPTAGNLESPPGQGWVVGRFTRFGLVGASGLVVNSAVLALAAGLLGVHYLVGVVLATQASTLWNFALVERWALREEERTGSRTVRYLQFSAMNNVALLARGPMVALMTDHAGIHYLVANLATLVALFLGRFLLADQLIWRRPVPSEV